MLAGSTAVYVGDFLQVMKTMLVPGVVIEDALIETKDAEGYKIDIGGLIRAAGAKFAWIDDPVAFNKAIGAAVRVLEAFKFSGTADDPISKLSVDQYVSDRLKDAHSSPHFEIIRSLLGDLINRLPPPDPE